MNMLLLLLLRSSELQQLIADGHVKSLRAFDKQGRSPLNLAIHSESLDTANVLLNHDADCAHLSDMQGYTALHAAVESGNPEMMKLILKFKPDLNAQTMNETEYAQVRRDSTFFMPVQLLW